MLNRLKHSNWSRYIGTLIIGGLLVALGYLIGDSAPNVEAQDGRVLIRFNVRDLYGSIWLGIIEEWPVLVLLDHVRFKLVLGTHQAWH